MKKTLKLVLSILGITIIASILFDSKVNATMGLQKIEGTEAYYYGYVPTGYSITYKDNTITVSNPNVYDRQEIDKENSLYKELKENAAAGDATYMTLINDFYFPLPEGTATIQAENLPIYTENFTNIHVGENGNAEIKDNQYYDITNGTVLTPKYAMIHQPILSTSQDYSNPGNIILLTMNTTNDETYIAYDKDGNKIEEATIKVEKVYKEMNNINVENKKISVFDNQYISGVVGESVQLKEYDIDSKTYSDLPSNFTYSSSNEEIVSVDVKGKLTFNKTGEADIIIKNEYGLVREYFVSVMTMDEWLIYNAPALSTEPGAEEKINTVADNDVVSIRRDKIPEVKANIFEKLATVNNSYLSVQCLDTQWIFKSNDIINKEISLNSKVTVTEEKPEVIKSDLAKDAFYIDFAHSGKLPGKAKVHIYLDQEAAFKKFGDQPRDLYFYYYNETTNIYEDAGIVKYDGLMLSLALKHCSKYAVTATKIDESLLGTPIVDDIPQGAATGSVPADPEPEKEPAKDDSPKTGVETYVALAGFIVAISLGTIAILSKNRE